MKTVTFFALITLLSLVCLIQAGAHPDGGRGPGPAQHHLETADWIPWQADERVGDARNWNVFPGTEVLFWADAEPGTAEFPTRAVPGPEVNDPESWFSDESPSQVYDIMPFADYADLDHRKGHAFQYLTEGCASVGNMDLPGDAGTDNNFFSNGIIQIEWSWDDNDQWGLVFRKSDQHAGYLVFYGHNCAPSVALVPLTPPPGADAGIADPTGACMAMRGDGLPDDDAGAYGWLPNNDWWFRMDHEHGMFECGVEHCERNAETRGDMIQGNVEVFFSRIEAIDNNIKVWFWRSDLIPDQTFWDDPLDPDSSKLGEPIIDVTDNRWDHRSGHIGVFNESQGNCAWDNLVVMDHSGWLASGGTSVDPNDKLSTYWGAVKDSEN